MDSRSPQKCPVLRTEYLLRAVIPVLRCTGSPVQYASRVMHLKAVTALQRYRSLKNDDSKHSRIPAGRMLWYSFSRNEAWFGLGGTTVVTFKGIGTFDKSWKSLDDALPPVSGYLPEKSNLSPITYDQVMLYRATSWSDSRPRWLTGFLPLTGSIHLQWRAEDTERAVKLRMEQRKIEMELALLRNKEESAKIAGLAGTPL